VSAGGAPDGSSDRPPGGLVAAVAAELDQLLAAADRELATAYPGDRPGRQPVHTAYVPADQFGPDLAERWGSAALVALERWAPGPAEFAAALGLGDTDAAELRRLVVAKLAAEPVEDVRIDFEDGYSRRGDAVEDADARAAAQALAEAVDAGTAPPFCGLRCKSLQPDTRRRAIATLGVFLGALLEHGPLPAGFVLTLPKVTSAAQVSAMTVLCERLEAAHGLGPGQLVFEVQVETPQIILGPGGAATVARCVHAGAGRLTGLHYGTYDYSAALGIAAAYQGMAHLVSDYARAVMQVAAAGTGVRLSDGSTNVLPIGDRADVLAAWRLHAGLVRRSLERGFYQGWDLHPAQLVSRYAATYAFFRDGMAPACARLRTYTDRVKTGLEEPATGRALAAYLIRGLDCGALTDHQVTELAGLRRDDLTALSKTGQFHA
jgi:citrate lyase beta subunit